MLIIITSTSVKLFSDVNMDDLELF